MAPCSTLGRFGLKLGSLPGVGPGGTHIYQPLEGCTGPCLAPRCPWCPWVTSGIGSFQPPAHLELGLKAWGTQGLGSKVKPQLTGPYV